MITFLAYDEPGENLAWWRSKFMINSSLSFIMFLKSLPAYIAGELCATPGVSRRWRTCNTDGRCRGSCSTSSLGWIAAGTFDFYFQVTHSMEIPVALFFSPLISLMACRGYWGKALGETIWSLPSRLIDNWKSARNSKRDRVIAICQKEAWNVIVHINIKKCHAHLASSSPIRWMDRTCIEFDQLGRWRKVQNNLNLNSSREATT